MKGIATFAFVSLCLAPAAMCAQGGVNRLTIPPGTRARITSALGAKDYVELNVVNTDRDTLRYRLPHSGATKALAWNQINRMEVSEGVHRHIARDMIVGLFGGAAAGALIGSATTRGGGDSDARGFAIYGGGEAGAIAGIVLGAVIGFAQRSERWVSVALSH